MSNSIGYFTQTLSARRRERKQRGREPDRNEVRLHNKQGNKNKNKYI